MDRDKDDRDVMRRMLEENLGKDEGERGEVEAFLQSLAQGARTGRDPSGAQVRLKGEEFERETESKKQYQESWQDKPGTMELRRAFLSQLWSDVLPSDSRGRESFLRWAERFSVEELFPTRDDVAPAGEPLTGGVPEVMVKATIEAEKAAGAGRLQAFLRQTLPATLRRWELEGTGTAENRIDLVLQPLLRNRVFPPCSERFRRFVAGLRGYLVENQPQAEQGSGMMQTWVALGDWLAETGGRECLLQAVVYYYEVLERLVFDPELAQAEPRLVSVQANNLAGRLDDVFPGSSIENERLLRVMNQLHQLHATFSPLAPTFPERAAGALRTFLELETDDETAVRMAHLASAMMRIPTAWMVGVDRLVEGWEPMTPFPLLASMEILAGAVRHGIVPASDRDEVPSALFNASVSFARSATTVTGDERLRYRWMTAMHASVGLWWSARLTDDAVEALTRMHGLSSAVNLLAAASDLRWPEKERQVFLELLQTLWAFKTEGLEEYFYRMRGALRDFGVDEKQLQGREASLDEFRTWLVEALRVLAARQGLRWPEVDEDAPDLEVVLARFLAETCEWFWGVEGWAGHRDRIIRLLEVLDERRSDPVEALEQHQQGLFRRPGDGSVAPGPLVAAGILDEAQWQILRDDAIRHPRSLADWVAEHADVLR